MERNVHTTIERGESMGNETEDRERAIDDILAQTTDPRVLAERLVIARRELRFMKMTLERQAERLPIHTTDRKLLTKEQREKWGY